MRKTSKRNLLWFTCSLLLIISSCSTEEKEDVKSNNELIELTLNSPLIDVQSKGRTTKTVSTNSEDRVDHIDVFITDKNGYIIPEVGKQRFTASQISNNKIALRTNPAISPQNFYVVANASSSLTTSVQTVTDLKRIRNGITSMVSSPFIMTGETEGVNVQIPSPKVNIQLQRTIARIDIKAAPDVSNFEIVNVELRNTSDVIYMFPTNPVNYMGSLADFKTPIPATDSKSVIGKVYAYESFNPDLNNLANTTCVIVGGYYNGDRSKLTYYRIDVLGSDNTARIWRGACYTLNINKILGKGWDTADEAEANKAENVIYTIDHWIDQSNNAVFDGQNYISTDIGNIIAAAREEYYYVNVKTSDLRNLRINSEGTISFMFVQENYYDDYLQLEIAINPNESGEYREGNVIIQLHNLTLKIPIFQYADDIRPEGPKELSFSPEGQSITLTPTLGKGWSLMSYIAEKPRWITTSNQSKTSVTLNASATTENRSGVIKIGYTHQVSKENFFIYTTLTQYKKDTYYIAASTNTDVNLVQGAGSYDANATCTLVAPSIAGYSFSHWEENGTNVSSNASYTFTVTGNRSLRAIFVPQMFTLTLSASEGGTVTGGGTFPSGTLTRITAYPKINFIFDAWYDDNKIEITKQADYYYKLQNSNKNLQAKFVNTQAAPRIYVSGTGDDARLELTTDPANFGAFFQFGSVIAWSGSLTPGPGTAVWNPTDNSSLSTWNKRWQIGSVYPTHVAANLTGGKGDPCRLVGYTQNYVQSEIRAGRTPDNKTWRMPTDNENTTYAASKSNWTTLVGVNGRYIGPGATPDGTGGEFLPASGHRDTNGALTNSGISGQYWSNSPQTSSGAWHLYLSTSQVTNGVSYQYYGLSVRCVRQNP